MTDFSIKNAPVGMDVPSSTDKDSEYDKLKKEYDAYIKKASKTDFANAPVIIQTRLDMLAQLKELAESQGLDDELAWINEEISSLTSADKTRTMLPPSYGLAASAPNLVYSDKEDTLDISKVLDECRDENGKYDENTVKLVMAFQNAGQKSEYSIPYIVKKCRDLDGKISPDKIKAFQLLASSGVDASFISNTIDSFFVKDNTDNDIDLNLCTRIAQLKSSGFEDMFSLQMAKLINSGYSDANMIISSVKNLLKAQVSPESAMDIIKALTVVDKQTGEKTIMPSAVNAVASVKTALVKSRGNEKSERKNPIYINNKPLEISKVGDSVIYMKKDGSFHTSYIDPNKSFQEAKKEYDDLISQTEDNILLAFIEKHKKPTGEINTNAARIITNLRSFGITHEKLLALTDLCLDKSGGIDVNKIGIIKQLKTSGMLSNDIDTTLDSIGKKPDGSYDKDDLALVCDLSGAYIGQPELGQLMPDVKAKDTLKGFIHDASPYFGYKNRLVELVNLTKSDGKNIDDVALEIVDDLLLSENNDKTEMTFVPFISEILDIARGSETMASEAAEKICCLIDLYSPDEIKDLLKLCVNSEGNVDKKLADAVYNAYHEGLGYNVIMAKVEACRNENGINYDKIDSVF